MPARSTREFTVLEVSTGHLPSRRLKPVNALQSEKTKLAVMLASLQRALEQGNEDRKVWSSFDSRNINKNRAKSLVEQARLLASQGRFESALNLALLASTEFQKFSDQSGRLFARFEDAHARQIWDQQASDLLRWSRRNGRRAVLVDKLEHLCVVFNKGKIERSYPANLGRNWYRQKIKEHDSSTPEGEYKVHKMNPSGKYGFALLLDYPTAVDRARFMDLKKTGAIPSDSRIGGNVEIHGRGRLSSDWTEGCVSLKDEDMQDLYRHSYVGMPVTIVGTCRLVSSLLQDP
jgi:murein L,D-transpeptidase YafK